MPSYEIIQLHDSSDQTKLQFPKVPLEALIEDPDHKDIPFGTPVRVIELMAIVTTGTIPTPTKAGQHYYSAATRKLYTSTAAGVWDNGVVPANGSIYKVSSPGSTSDTLYVKSIDINGASLSPLVLTGYVGPFLCMMAGGSGTTRTCVIATGKVYAGWKEYTIPAVAVANAISVASGETIYLVGTNGSPDATFQYTTDVTATGDMRVRIAYNDGGTLVQCQYGDIQTSALT